MSTLFEKIQSYRAGKFQELKDHYAELQQGQKPPVLMITCSDSRLCPQEFTQTDAGELFIIRNAGNLIAAHNPQAPTNEGLTLEYGVSALNVKEVVVVGHSGCGAMDGLMNLDKIESLPLVHRGLATYEQQHKQEVQSCSSLKDLIAWNVRQQVKNILTYPFIQEGIQDRGLSVYGVVYNFANAEIEYHCYANSQGEVKHEN